LVFVVLAWGLNFVILKNAFAEWPTEVMMVLRYLLMVPCLWIYARLTGQLFWPAKGEGLKHWLAGFMSTGLYMVLFMEGMARVGAAQGAVCLATAPIWVSIFSVVLGQDRGRWGLYFGGGLAYAGVAAVILLGTGDRHWTPLGLLLTLGSALVWAISVVMMKPLLEDRPPIGVYLASYPGAALVLLPYGLKSVIGFDYSVISGYGWFGLAYLTIVAGTLAFGAYYASVQQVGPARASMVAYFVPLVAAASAWLIRGESMNWLQIAGVGVVLVGVAIATRKPVVAGSDSKVCETS
jgi:drug/metabolite transporter (DMT)-like permease